MNQKDFFRSKLFKKILYGVGGAVLALLVFQAGIFVGYRKAAFSYRWGDSYYHAFGRSRRDFHGMFPREDFLDAHGVAGKILKIALPTLVIEGKDTIEKVVVVRDDTLIRRFRDTLHPSDLKPDDFVVVIGSPNQEAQIEAKLIRLIPVPFEGMQEEKVSTSTRP